MNTSVQVLRKDDLGIGAAQPRQHLHPPFQEDVLEPAPAFSHLSSIVGPLQTVLEREGAGPAVIRPQHPQQQQQQYAAHPFSLSSDAMQQRPPAPSSRSVSMATSSSLHPRDSLREEPVESYREERASGSRRAAAGAHQQPPRDSPRGRELEASPRTSGSASHSVRSRAPDREIGFHKNKVASPSPSSTIKIAVLPPKSPPPKFPDWSTGAGPAVLAPADADRLLVDDAQGVEADGGQLGHEDDEDSLMSSGWATLPASSSGARGGKTKTKKREDANIVGSGDEEDADGQSTPSSSLDEDDEELLDERKLPAKLIPVSAQGALRLKARAQEAGNHGSAEAAGNKTSAEVAASTSSTSRNNEPSAPRNETAIGSGGKNSAQHLTATTSSSTTAARPQRTETTTSSSSTAANNTSKKFIDIPRIQYTAISDDEFSDGEDGGAAEDYAPSSSSSAWGGSAARVSAKLPHRPESLKFHYLGDEDGDDDALEDGSDDEEVNAILAKYTRNLQ